MCLVGNGDSHEVVVVDQRGVVEPELQGKRLGETLKEEAFGGSMPADQKQWLTGCQGREHHRLEMRPTFQAERPGEQGRGGWGSRGFRGGLRAGFCGWFGGNRLLARGGFFGTPWLAVCDAHSTPPLTARRRSWSRNFRARSRCGVPRLWRTRRLV